MNQKKKENKGSGSGGDSASSSSEGKKFYAKARSSARDGPLYDNCAILAPDGKTFMAYCSRRKVDWYVSRALAGLIETDPPTIRLLFEPKGCGHANDPFYSAKKTSECVVCGAREELCRYHVVPSAYRKHFPSRLKSHSSHDVVLLCVDHMAVANANAASMVAELVAHYGVPESGIGEAKVVNPAKRAAQSHARVLVRHRAGSVQLPPERVDELYAELSELLGVPRDEIDLEAVLRTAIAEPNPDWISHGAAVVARAVDEGQADGLTYDEAIHALVRRFRVAFLEGNQPQFLSEAWSVAHVDQA